MSLTIIEHLVLWGIPLLSLLITLGYYFYWGKEAEELQTEPIEEPSTDGGGR